MKPKFIQLIWLVFLLFLMLPALSFSKEKKCKPFSSWHQSLFNAYKGLHAPLYQYAGGLGFSEDCSQKIIVLHELIHIDSATHRSFVVDQTHLKPYIFNPVWPSINNAYVISRISRAEEVAIGYLLKAYVKPNPENKIPNILDELNAYGQTVGYFVSGTRHHKKYRTRMAQYLYLLDAYLRVCKKNFPNQYYRMARNKDTHSTLQRIVIQAQPAWSVQERLRMNLRILNITEFINLKK